MQAEWELHSKMLGEMGGSQILVFLGNLLKSYLPASHTHLNLTISIGESNTPKGLLNKTECNNYRIQYSKSLNRN